MCSKNLVIAVLLLVVLLLCSMVYLTINAVERVFIELGSQILPVLGKFFFHQYL